MPKDFEKYEYTQNRELSWLRFNQRVLEEASDRDVPTLERLKFTAIFSSNLDEFFMVRVGSLFDVSLISPDEIDNKTGMTSLQQLDKIYGLIPGMIELKRQIYASISSDLKQIGIVDLKFSELSAAEKKIANSYFTQKIRPILSPIIIGSHHPVPHLVNKQLYVAALLKSKKGKESIGIVSIPDILPQYIAMPESDTRFIRTENLVLQWAPTLFGFYQVSEVCIICVTRNADLSFDDDKFEDNDIDFRNRVSKLLKKRDNLAVIRLEINSKISKDFESTLANLVQVKNYQIYYDSCPLNMKYVFGLTTQISHTKSQELLYKPYEPRWPEDINHTQGIIEQIQLRDRLLFYPFDSVNPFLQLLSEAAERKDVISIKITIYRLASLSKIVHTLCRAAENGKQIIVIMELRARFDEANNISWSKLLEDAGCQVIYGIPDYKCHSKLCLITMKNKGKFSYITQIGTGNYNEKTNAMYTDLSIMTASEGIGNDATLFFQNMLINNLEGKYNHLLVAPNGIKSTLLKLIDKQIEKGANGYICIKANSVTEREVINKLKEASQAGVEIQLIIRGICCILPGVKTHTDNVHVTSIVGRYLEHARIYCFGKGDESKIYISSADLMTRNLNRRVEIACPVYNNEIKEQLKWILTCELRDTAKASFMMSDGSYSRKQSHQPMQYDSQQQFMDLSLHKPAPIIEPKFNLIKKFNKLFKWIFRS